MSSRPKLLDLFCGAGGAAMGYHRAGFEVVGVDIKAQRNFPFEFIQADALKVPLRGFDLIHASPPCQHWSRATKWRHNGWNGDHTQHPDLIAATRRRLLRSGASYVIENVQEARHELRNPLMLCGTMFGIPAQSHRYFELWGTPAVLPPDICHHGPSDVSRDHGGKQPESVFRDTIGCHWMNVHEAREAILPAYTELIGRRFLGRRQRRSPI